MIEITLALSANNEANLAMILNSQWIIHPNNQQIHNSGWLAVVNGRSHVGPVYSIIWCDENGSPAAQIALKKDYPNQATYDNIQFVVLRVRPQFEFIVYSRESISKWMSGFRSSQLPSTNSSIMCSTCGWTRNQICVVCDSVSCGVKYVLWLISQINTLPEINFRVRLLRLHCGFNFNFGKIWYLDKHHQHTFDPDEDFEKAYLSQNGES